jgi:hypothetical protein
MSIYGVDPCEKCEEMMQDYLDRELTGRDASAESHSTNAASVCWAALRKVSASTRIRTRPPNDAVGRAEVARAIELR